MAEDPRSLLFIYALQNAVHHQNVPKAGTVLGTLMGKHPELRSRAKEMSGILKEVLDEVAVLSPEEREKRLADIAPELLENEKEKKTRELELPPLEGAEHGVVMRFAPNPSGPLHLGHARAAYLNDYYVRKFKGHYVLRIEDTDPRRVEPENYQLLLDDIEWMGLGITDLVYQSDRLEIYYEYCRRLIEIGGAYVCTCDSEAFRELKIARTECPCRGREIGENLDLWDRMLAGEYLEGMVTVRVKTEIDHPDPAMRDFSIFRIVDSPPHPRRDARVYPLMNFSVVIDDHLLGITHVIRGKDHIANTRRQRYIYDYFGWIPPYYIHYGRMSIGDVVLSTSAMKEGIAEGRYSGWDDIHLGTLKAIARRGFEAEAVRRAMIDIGIGQSDISFSWENLYAQNKALIDPVTNRYFFVPDPLRLSVADAPDQTARIPLHPNDPGRGQRELRFTGTLLVSREDIDGRSLVRLKDLFNIQIAWEDGEPTLTYAGDSLDEARAAKAPIVQWLPEDAAIPCLLRRPAGDLSGYCEPVVAGEIGKVVQFERVGFVRIDEVSDRGIRAYFAHR
jgi:glutamyl-tRNA synthetase